ncbi:MAG: DUF4270 family protein [Bergeyella sp.]
MINRFKKFFNIASAAVVGGMIMWNCEPDADLLGSQFFTGAEAVDASFPLIAYNVSNNDLILRADGGRLDSVAVGAFTEPRFGMQKASYVTQLRLSTYDPDFGDNPVLDSVVLTIKPAYESAEDSITTTTVDDYKYGDDEIESKKVVTTYPVKKYGKTKINGNDAVLNIKVHEVTDFLGSASDSISSNKSVALGAEIGSKEFNGKITSVKITKDTDNSELFTRDASIRMNLDKDFFQNKIIAKEGATQLADAASFIRYFKGIRISVQEDDGYLFKFVPTSIDITMYYKKDETDDDNTVERVEDTYTFNTTISNALFSQVQYDRTGTNIAVQDTISGNAKLYVQGMGGGGAGFKIPETTITELRNKYKNDKIGIITAKIRVYTDEETWNNNYKKPDYFTVKQKDSYDFLTDMATLSGSGNYYLVKTYNLYSNPAYYDIGITQTIRNIVENEVEPQHFIINVGNYTYDSYGSLVGSSYTDSQNYNTYGYTPYRAVLVGTVLDEQDPLFSKGAKLLITYGQR